MGLLSRLLKRAGSYVDDGLARDYDRALNQGANREARSLLLEYDPRFEHAAYASRNRVSQVRTDEAADSVTMPRNPFSGDAWAHHTHPMASGAGVPAPLSDADLSMVFRRTRDKGSFAHEVLGGGSYAARGRRAGKGLRALGAANDLIENNQRFRDGVVARAGDDPDAYLAMIPLGRAAKRHGLLSRYGYRPSNEHQAEMLDLNTDAMRYIEDQLFRAMHGSIYGLPYPLTVGRIGAGAAAGYGAYEALS